MQLENYLIKGLAFDNKVRVFLVENTELIKAICGGPEVRSRLLKRALGTTVSAASLLTGTLKDRQRLSMKVRASYPDCKIFADVDAYGNIRGYLSESVLHAPLEQWAGLTLSQWIGNKGCLQVVKDAGMHHTFTGITDMPYGNIVDDLVHYFKQSEQTSTCFAIQIDINKNNEILRSQGIMAQLLPGAPYHVIDDIRSILDLQPGLRSISEPQTPDSSRRFLSSLFKGIEFIGLQPIQAFCGCSKPMFYPMLLALGEDALKCTLKEEQSIEMVCHVCGIKYVFGHDEISRLCCGTIQG
ncbi:33 kDa chaperonin [compost metagenome]